MANIQQAISWLNNDKKVRRRLWRRTIYAKHYCFEMYEDGKYVPESRIQCNDILATDWEIFKEPNQTLYNKSDFCEKECCNIFKERDVKEAIQKVIQTNNVKLDVHILKCTLMEHFGKELL